MVMLVRIEVLMLIFRMVVVVDVASFEVFQFRSLPVSGVGVGVVEEYE